jgi:hypothetical protein
LAAGRQGVDCRYFFGHSNARCDQQHDGIDQQEDRS